MNVNTEDSLLRDCFLATRKNENWKYSDLSFLAQENFSAAKKIEADHLTDTIHQHRLRTGDAILMVMINGYFSPAYSDLAKLPEDVIACSMNVALQQHAAIIKTKIAVVEINTEKFPFAALNAAQFNDGLFFMLPDYCELSAPLHLLSLST